MMQDLATGIVEAVAGADVLLLHRIAFEHGYFVAKAMGIASLGLELFPSGFAPTVEMPPAALGGRQGPLWLRRLLVAYAPFREQTLFRLLRHPGVPGTARFAAHGRPRAAARDGHHSLADLPRFQSRHRAPTGRLASGVRGGRLLVAAAAIWLQPQVELVDFLASGPPPVFIGFGSMSPGDSERLSELTVSALRHAGGRGLIQAGWAGLAASGDDVLMIDEQPHDWLFPQMAAVVHHAGAGTTGSGIAGRGAGRRGAGAGRPAILGLSFCPNRRQSGSDTLPRT